MTVFVTLAGFITLLTGCGKSKDEAPGATGQGDMTSPSVAKPPAESKSPVETKPAVDTKTTAAASSKSPVVILTQTPEFPKPGQFVQFPRGLVAALWSDGRIVRTVDPSTVGTSYVSGSVKAQDRDEFIAYLKSDAVMKAPKLPHLRLHSATLQATIITESGKEKWVTEIPDDSSVWVEVRKRLLNLPLTEGKAADATAVEDASKEE